MLPLTATSYHLLCWGLARQGGNCFKAAPKCGWEQVSEPHCSTCPIWAPGGNSSPGQDAQTITSQVGAMPGARHLLVSKGKQMVLEGAHSSAAEAGISLHIGWPPLEGLWLPHSPCDFFFLSFQPFCCKPHTVVRLYSLMDRKPGLLATFATLLLGGLQHGLSFFHPFPPQ